MQTDGLQEKLNHLWASIIDEYYFDVLRHTIRFKTRVINFGETTNYDLKFDEVASFYFVGGLNEDRYCWPVPDEGDYVELTSIRFVPDGIGDIKINPQGNWKNHYPSVPNFAIELWNKMLFIEAASVSVNGTIYHLGYAC